MPGGSGLVGLDARAVYRATEAQWGFSYRRRHFVFTLPLLGNTSRAPVLTRALVDIEITAVLLGHFREMDACLILGQDAFCWHNRQGHGDR